MKEKNVNYFWSTEFDLARCADWYKINRYTGKEPEQIDQK